MKGVVRVDGCGDLLRAEIGLVEEPPEPISFDDSLPYVRPPRYRIEVDGGVRFRSAAVPFTFLAQGHTVVVTGVAHIRPTEVDVTRPRRYAPMRILRLTGLDIKGEFTVRSLAPAGHVCTEERS